ncbi:MAG: hypothetical protein O2910_08265 [Proteobacteria bacterium]|nr:hypothetical protein [Pseudomonadota bacterium]
MKFFTGQTSFPATPATQPGYLHCGQKEIGRLFHTTALRKIHQRRKRSGAVGLQFSNWLKDGLSSYFGFMLHNFSGGGQGLSNNQKA